jgi:hypothetical protein
MSGAHLDEALAPYREEVVEEVVEGPTPAAGTSEPERLPKPFRASQDDEATQARPALPPHAPGAEARARAPPREDHSPLTV